MKFNAMTFLVLLGAGLLLPCVAPAEELAPGYETCMRRAHAVDEEVDCLAMAEAWWDKQESAALARAEKSCAMSVAPNECRASLKDAQRRWTSYRQGAWRKNAQAGFRPAAGPFPRSICAQSPPAGLGRAGRLTYKESS